VLNLSATTSQKRMVAMFVIVGLQTTIHVQLTCMLIDASPHYISHA